MPIVANATAGIGYKVMDRSFTDRGEEIRIAISKKAATELLRVFNRGDIEIDRNSVGNVECRGKWGGIGQAYEVVNATVGYSEIGSGGRSDGGCSDCKYQPIVKLSQFSTSAGRSSGSDFV